MKRPVSKIIISSFLCLVLSLQAQLKVGDPGVNFDMSKLDADYPEMTEWMTAGVVGGIPFLTDVYSVEVTACSTIDLQKHIDETSSKGGGQILLKEGVYTIDETLNLKNNVILVGESKTNTTLNITKKGTEGAGIYINCKRAGICQLTVQGGYGTPTPFLMENMMPDFVINSINFGSSSSNCWLDNINILNSGSSAISTWRTSHLTVRACLIEGAWNKGGGGRGYVQFAGDHCLMTNTTVREMRHIAIQREGCKYNVFYKNDVEQDFNFHNADAGHNLIEQNTSRLPAGLGKGWHAMMGPWSVQHNIPGKRNFIFNNNCIEYNNDNIATFSNPSYVYIPARFENNSPFDISMNTPSGGTFYPIQLEKKSKIDKSLIHTEIEIYPQPCNNFLSVTTNHSFKHSNVSLLDNLGRTVFSKVINNKNFTLNTDKLNSGLYVLTVETTERKISKIIIKE